MAADPRVFLIGQGLWSPWYAGGSLENLDREFGRERVLDSPVSENAVTGMAVGAALAGMRPIVFHPRLDFLLLAMDPMINQAANWSYLFAGQSSVPLVIRAVINRGGEQGAQHSQALHAMFMHVPGLKIVMPATPADAKGLLLAAVEDPNPVLYIDDRWLYSQTGPVPEEMYRTPIGEAAVRRAGRDVTIVGISWMAAQALEAADVLAGEGIEAEVIDLRSLKPWDQVRVLESARKTGRLMVADPGWRTAGAAAEIAATVAAEAFHDLDAPVERVTLPDTPAPTSRAEEQAYYPGPAAIVEAAWRALGPAREAAPDSRRPPHETTAHGSGFRHRGRAVRAHRAVPAARLIALAVWLEDRRSPWFRGVRVGRGGRRFRMVKFRTMIPDAWKSGVSSTACGDRRITRVGKILRRAKLDELPQLWNVLTGDMSLVGPRPQVEPDAALYTAEERRLFDVRPGITDLASIVFADEGEILAGSADPDLVTTRASGRGRAGWVSCI